MRKFVMWAGMTLLSSCLFAQQTLTPEQFLEGVRNHHPLARKAGLEVAVSEANLLSSRGVFDPSIALSRQAKRFEGFNYYSRNINEIKVPLWSGIDIYAGWMSNTGDRLNTEETKGGTGYAAITIPLIRNFIVDSRRASVKMAATAQKEAQASRLLALNNLLAEAQITYWEWWEKFHLLEEVRKWKGTAIVRHQMVKTQYSLGERAAIDTLESFSQVKMMEIREGEAWAGLQESRFELSLYAWDENGQQAVLSHDLVPAAPADEPGAFYALLEKSLAHPGLVKIDREIDMLRIERKLKLQQLVPEVYATYESLARDVSTAFINGLTGNNYYYGLSLKLPLRLSEARGEYRATRLKLQLAELEKDLGTASIQTNLRQFFTTWQVLNDQVERQQEIVQAYEKLQRGENTRFTAGESSLFLVNERESRALEARQKLISLQAKTKQAMTRMRWAAGNFSDL